jgi:hypothetical protein
MVSPLHDGHTFRLAVFTITLLYQSLNFLWSHKIVLPDAYRFNTAPETRIAERFGRHITESSSVDGFEEELISHADVTWLTTLFFFIFSGAFPEEIIPCNTPFLCHHLMAPTDT